MAVFVGATILRKINFYRDYVDFCSDSHIAKTLLLSPNKTIQSDLMFTDLVMLRN